MFPLFLPWIIDDRESDEYFNGTDSATETLFHESPFSGANLRRDWRRG